MNINNTLHTYRSIFAEAAWYIFGNGIVQLCSLISVLFVVRYLGPVNNGLYSFVQIFIAACTTILSGFDTYANWHIIHSKDKYSELIAYTVQKSFIAGGVLSIFIPVAYVLIPHDVFLLALISLFPLVTSIVSSWIMLTQFEKQASLVSRSMAFSAVLLLLLRLTAVYMKAPLSWFVFINSLDGIILAGVALRYITKTHARPLKMPSVLSHISYRSLTTLLRNSFFPFLYVVFWFLFIRSDQFIIPLFFGAYGLGVYAPAVKVVEMCNVIIVILQAVVLPRILHLTDAAASPTRVRVIARIYFFVGIGIAFFISLTAPIAVLILFGHKYEESIPILQIYAWTLPGLFLSYYFALIFQSLRKFHMLAWHAFVCMAVSITVLFFVSDYVASLPAVASISVVAYSISAMTYYLLWKRNIMMRGSLVS